jgi:hypothetical protein
VTKNVPGRVTPFGTNGESHPWDKNFSLEGRDISSHRDLSAGTAREIVGDRLRESLFG